MPFLLEIAVQSVAAAIAAQAAGADRIELCADLDEGGVTPTFATMQDARGALSIPIFAMIRPRPGDFVYCESEFATMREQIQQAKRAGLDGVVLGILAANREIDIAQTVALVAESAPLPVTFHRAFDEAGATLALLEQVIATGAKRVLTSGGAPSAPDGVPRIRQLLLAASSRIVVVPGAGINATNFLETRRATGAHEFHAGLGSIQRYGSSDLSRFSKEIRSIVAHKTPGD
jgi:copper homeostasis protein